MERCLFSRFLKESMTPKEKNNYLRLSEVEGSLEVKVPWLSFHSWAD